MSDKFSWQDKWYRVKDKTLGKLDSVFLEPDLASTITSSNQLPNICVQATFPFSTAEEARDAFSGAKKLDIYTRLTNPTLTELENILTLLEAQHFIGDLDDERLNDKIDQCAVKTNLFGSGMAAISHTFLSLLNSGDSMITDRVLYGCSDNLIIDDLPRRGINVIEIDVSNLEHVAEAFRNNPETKLIYFETPANPTLGVRDIQEISKIARSYGSLVVIDNTFATPCFQNPLRLGADIVIHSLTKFVNGHSDILGGSVTGPAVFIKGELFYARRIYGGVMNQYAAEQIYRGLMTLPLRMEKHYSNAQKVIDFLKEHSAIKKLHYPGLDGREIASKQMRCYGSLIGLETMGDEKTTEGVVDRVKDRLVGYIAVSLGAPFTLFDWPAGMTHYFVPPEKRLEKGIAPTLIRVSVGLEGIPQILNTFEYMLQNVKC